MAIRPGYNLGMVLLLLGVLIALIYIIGRIGGYAEINPVVAILAIILILAGRILISRFSPGRRR
jgi:hypothetical protein